MQSKSCIEFGKRPWLKNYSRSTSAPLKNIPQHLVGKIPDAVRPKSSKVASHTDEPTTAPTKVVDGAKKVFVRLTEASLSSRVDSGKKKPDIQQDKRQHTDPSIFMEKAKIILEKISQDAISAEQRIETPRSERVRDISRANEAEKAKLLLNVLETTPNSLNTDRLFQMVDDAMARLDQQTQESDEVLAIITKLFKERLAARITDFESPISPSDDNEASHHESESTMRPNHLLTWLVSRVQTFKFDTNAIKPANIKKEIRDKIESLTPKTKVSRTQQKESDQHSKNKTKPKQDAFTEDTAASTGSKSTNPQRKGAFEEYWSEFRMQGPPPAAASSSSQSSSVSESKACGSVSKDQKLLTAERLSRGEKYRIRDQELSELQPKYGVTSRWPPRGSQTTIYAKDRRPESKRKTEGEDPRETSEKQHLQKGKKVTASQVSKPFDKTWKKEGPRTGGSAKSLTERPPSVRDQDMYRQEKFTCSRPAVMKPAWYWKLMSRAGIPDHLPETTAAGSETSTDDVEQNIPVQGATTVSSKKKESIKVKPAVKMTSSIRSFKQGMRKFHTADAGTTSAAKLPLATDRRPTKSRIKIFSTPKYTAHGSAEKLVGPIVEAAQDLKIVSPSAVQKQSRKDWASNAFHFSSIEQLLAASKTAISSLPDIFTSDHSTSSPPNKKKWTWRLWLLASSKLGSQTPIREQTPSEEAWEENFFTEHPNYRVQTSINKTAQAILEISGTLYTIIDQLMAEGNKHFDTMTRLQGAWEGLLRAEAVMDSSRTVKGMARDTENRKLLKSYVEVVHKLDRLVDGVSEVTSRLGNSTSVDAADARQWMTLRSRFNKFLWEVRKRPLFVDKGILVSEGFHRDILLGDKEKLENVKATLRRLQDSSVV